jgi:dipeptidyl aminopeptidase/acylaminoacyl peptidase
MGFKPATSSRRYAVASALAVVLLAYLVTPSLATFSGPDGRISFARFVEQSKGFEIFTANPDGSDVQQLTNSLGKGRNSIISDWSPDGQQIAFDSDRVDVDGQGKDTVQIYVSNPDGSGLVQLTRGAGFHGNPGWSPDASLIAIEGDWGDYPASEGIWIIPSSDADGVTIGEATRITTTPEGVDFDSEPQFSPDGSSLVFTRFKSERRSAIYRVNVDGTGLQQLTPWKLNASDPDWSPDGQMITFDSGDVGRPGSKLDIYVMHADGSVRTRLTNSPRLRKGEPFVGANNPVWSPSGTRIMYTHFLSERSDLAVMNADGSGKTKIALPGRHFDNKVDWGTHP